MRQPLEQIAQAQEVLDPEMRPASRDDTEGILCRQIGPLDRDALRVPVIVVEVGTVAPGPANPAFSQAELVPEEGMVGMGYPEALYGSRELGL